VQKIAELGVGQAIAGLRQVLAGEEQARHRRRAAGDRGEQPADHRDLRADPEAVAGAGHRRCDDFAQRQAAGTAMQGEQTDERAGHGCGRLADVEDLRRLPEIDGDRREVERRQCREPAPWCGAEEVEHLIAVPGVAPEAGAAAAQRSQRQFADGGGELRGDDRVDRVAAMAQQTRARRRRMRFRCRDDSTNAHRPSIRDEVAGGKRARSARDEGLVYCACEARSMARRVRAGRSRLTSKHGTMPARLKKATTAGARGLRFN
jgi:hypothetical protein